MDSWKRPLIIVCFCHWVADFFIGIWPAYKTLAGLDLATAGIIMGVSGLVGDGSQFFFGSLADRGHRKWLIALGVTMTSSACLLGLTRDPALLFPLVILILLGSGIFHPVGAGTVQNLLPSRKGFTMGVFAAGGALGFGMGQLAFSSLYASSSLLPLLLMPIALVAVYFVQKAQFRESTAPKPRLSFRQLFAPFMESEHRKSLRMLYFMQLSQQSIMYGTIFLLPDVLKMQGHADWLCFGGGHCFFVLGSAALLVPIGMLADRIGQKKVILGMGCISAVLFYTFLFSGTLSSIMLIPLLFALGACMAGFNPIGVSWGNRLVPEYSGSISALLMGGVWSVAYGIGGGFGGFLTTLFAENAPQMALASLGTLFSIAILFSILIPAPQKQCLAPTT